MMENVTKIDISELNKRIDELIEQITSMRVAAKALETIVKLAPKFPDRPCPDVVAVKKNLDNHITNHKEAVKIWLKPVIAIVMDLLKLGIIAFITWWFVQAS